MANHWLRLWYDLPNDPKWRTVARISQRPISEVIAVYIHMLVSAANATERGRTQTNDEDLASALDIDISAVSAIRAAMQARVLEGDLLTGWNRRQPKREDESASRSKDWRESQKAGAQPRTQPNADERKRTQEEDAEESREEVKKDASHLKKDEEHPDDDTPRVRLPFSALPPDWMNWALQEFGWTEQIVIEVWEEFKDYWLGLKGPKSRKSNWLTTWKSRCRAKRIHINGGTLANKNRLHDNRSPLHRAVENTLDIVAAREARMAKGSALTIPTGTELAYEDVR